MHFASDHMRFLQFHIMQHVMWQMLVHRENMVSVCVCVWGTKAESWEFNRNLVSCSKAIARWVVSHFCGFTLHAYEQNSLECIILFDCILNVQLCVRIKSKFWSDSLRSHFYCFWMFALLSLCRLHCNRLAEMVVVAVAVVAAFLLLRHSVVYLKLILERKKEAKLCSAFILDAKVLSLKCKTKCSKWMQQWQQQHFDGHEYLIWICQYFWVQLFYCSEANESVLLLKLTLHLKCVLVLARIRTMYTLSSARWKVFSSLKPLAEQIGIFALSTEFLQVKSFYYVHTHKHTVKLKRIWRAYDCRINRPAIRLFRFICYLSLSCPCSIFISCFRSYLIQLKKFNILKMNSLLVLHKSICWFLLLTKKTHSSLGIWFWEALLLIRIGKCVSMSKLHEEIRKKTFLPVKCSFASWNKWFSFGDIWWTSQKFQWDAQRERGRDT